ncbi:hypothetical protein D3C77_515270 [compost metagenome]
MPRQPRPDPYRNSNRRHSLESLDSAIPMPALSLPNFPVRALLQLFSKLPPDAALSHRLVAQPRQYAVNPGQAVCVLPRTLRQLADGNRPFSLSTPVDFAVSAPQPSLEITD